MNLRSDEVPKLKVLKYVRDMNYHECSDEHGDLHRVDLFVDGPNGETHESIVGKTIQVDSLHAFEEIAQGVKVLPE